MSNIEFRSKGTEKNADLQVIVSEMVIYWCFCVKIPSLSQGIDVLQVRRPEGVRRNALRAQRPK